MFRRRRYRRWRRWPRRRRRFKRHGWRRRHFRRRAVSRQTVHEWIPGRHRVVTVRGWEPLGNLCSTDTPKQEASPYHSVEPQTATGQWHGTWGKHYFTVQNLLLRAQARWNQWSDDWTTYDYIKFTGGAILIPPPSSTQFMINFDPYLQTTVLLYQEKNAEDKYIHPGILMHDPKTHIIFAANYMPRKRMYKIRIKPPPGWKGYQRFPDAMGYILTHWAWTWFSMNQAFFTTTGQGSVCAAEPWWSGNNYLQKWVDRSKYEDISASTGRNWGPFLPAKYGNYPETSLFFKYKLFFKLVGNAIWRPLPRNYLKDGLVDQPEGPTAGGEADSPTAHKKARKRISRPTSEADIRHSDLDSDGILTSPAYRRITYDHSRPKRRKLEDLQRLGSLYDRVQHVLAEFNLLK
ncbi:ORF1 [Torque teno felis virus 2]|uniref:Capsid protein n=1 Tax=Torque teno felis virus 2 TaxID=2065043 RepID=A8DMP7_9VIRU|nr:ORF1 [Torque teno felis virus 2]ABU55881.1 ORF1 [Torque teno felis virus 2]